MQHITPKMNHENNEPNTLSLGDLALEIKNQLNYILGNSQIILDIWKEAEKIFLSQTDNYQNDFICGIPYDHLPKVVTQMLRDIIDGSLKINNLVYNLKDMDKKNDRENANI